MPDYVGADSEKANSFSQREFMRVPLEAIERGARARHMTP